MTQNLNYIKMLSIQVMKNRKNINYLKKIISEIERLKGLSDNDEFDKIFQEIYDSKKYPFEDIRDNYIIGNLYPKSINKMRECPEFKFTNDFYTELRWQFFIFATNAKNISSFVEMRREYDSCVLLGKYAEAVIILDKIEKAYGFSFWLMESRLFLSSQLDDFGNLFITNELDNLDTAILYFFELKNRENMTWDEYQHIVNKELLSLNNTIKTYPQLNEIIHYFNYRIASLTYNLDESRILSLLKISINDPIIDRYLLCLDILKYSITLDPSSKMCNDIRSIIGMLQIIEDEQLESSRFYFDKKENQNNYIIREKLQYAKSSFISNDLEGCRNLTREILKKTPYNIQAINLMVEVNILQNKSNDEFENTILGDLITSLNIIYPMGNQRDEKIDNIYKIMNSCSQSNWASFISNAVNNRCRLINSNEEISTRKIESCQYLDIETICNCMEKEDALEFLSNSSSSSRYLDLKLALLKGEYDEAEEICKLNDFKYLLKFCNPKANLDEKKECVEAVRGKKNTFELLISKYYLVYLDKQEEFQASLEFAVDLMVNNIYTSLFVQIDDYIKVIEEMESDISANICVPILYYIKFRYFSKELKDDVSAVCEDFLYFSNLKLPSNMKSYDDYSENKRLIFFLKNVCSTEILSTAVASIISNSIDLAQERLNICLMLCKLDPNNEKIYEQEIRSITQKKKINSELRIIQENRIHVNIDGIRQDLIDIYKNDFLRYKLYEDNSVNELIKAIHSKKQSIIFMNRDSNRVLKELILNIRDAFVSSNEYGLDGYLSLNIRHGAISDALRSSLIKENLLAVYNTETKEYEIDNIWINNLCDNDILIINQAILNFSNMTDTIIEDLKTKHIQIKTEKACSDGIFDYTISDIEYDIIMTKSHNFDEFDEFLNYIIDFMWEKTENNLQKMKSMLKDQIEQKYSDAFAELKNDLKMVCDKNGIAGITRRIIEAEIEMPNVINKVCFWFQRSTESKHTDFDLEFVFNMGIETIINMHPETNFIPKKIATSFKDEKIEGKNLKLYSDIFYNLLDNIYKKACRKGKNTVYIEYELRQCDGIQYIFLQNDYSCSNNLQQDKHKLDELRIILKTKEYLNRVKGEGGTGIPKICKIISVDLRRNANIDFDFIENENKFFIKIEM